MKILLDTNIAIDFLERRQPHFPVALEFINIAKKEGHTLLIAASSVDNIAYILRKKFSREEIMKGLLRFFKICDLASVNQNIILQALNSGWKDFEDAIQYFSAIEAGANLIVTRDVKGYEEQKVKVVSLENALNSLIGNK